MRTTIIKAFTAVAASGVFALAVIAATAGPSVAGGGVECVTVEHANTQPYVNLAADGTTHTNGTFTLTANGVKIVTPDNAAKVYGYFELTPHVTLTNIKDAGFANVNGSGLLPSYQFGLYVDDKWAGTLAWESAYQPAGLTNPSDVLHHGGSKWYITKDIPGVYTNHTVKTWNELVTLLPKNSTAAYYGINQGSGGIATNTVNNVKLKTMTWCKTHKWSDCITPAASASASASVSVSASARPSTSSAAGHPTVLPSVSAPPSLPVTGANATTVALIGGTSTAAGIGLAFLVRRRKRVTFTP